MSADMTAQNPSRASQVSTFGTRPLTEPVGHVSWNCESKTKYVFDSMLTRKVNLNYARSLSNDWGEPQTDAQETEVTLKPGRVLFLNK